MYVLIDSNNFFVSCERLFRPQWNDVATIVLSSNDGCAVARSNEAKALGVKMGEPLHVLKQRFTIVESRDKSQETRKKRIPPYGDPSIQRKPDVATRLDSCLLTHDSQKPPLVVFSANFALYGDISRRVGAVLARITPRIEFYSIDEAFLDISQLDIKDYTVWGRALAAKIQREVGIPVSVGIAPTKTLCKLAADYAKHHETHGCFVMQSNTNRYDFERTARAAAKIAAGGGQASASETTHYLRRGEPLLQNCLQDILYSVPVQDVWGVGWRLAPKLKAEGIHTAADLARMRPKQAQQLMGIVGRRMVAELNGVPCIPLTSTHKPQAVISRGRQFGRDTSDVNVVSAAVARMANHAAKALRDEGLLATRATVWLSTNRKKPSYTAWHRETQFYTPTADTGIISHQLLRLLERDFDAEHAWHKAEVTLWNLVPDRMLQTDVFGFVQPVRHQRSTRLMTALDQINHKYGKHALRYATEDMSHLWEPRANMQSPNYTSSWQDVPIIFSS